MQPTLILTIEPAGEEPIPLLRLTSREAVRAATAVALRDAQRLAEVFADDEALGVAARSEAEVLRGILLAIDGAAGAVN